MDHIEEAYFNRSNEMEEGAESQKSDIDGFEIFHITDQITCKVATQPHRLGFYMISLNLAGEGIYHFSNGEYYTKKDTLCLVSPYVLTSWHSQTPDQQGHCVVFTEAFFHENLENKQLLQ